MQATQTYRFRRAAWQCVLGIIVLALLTLVAFRLDAGAATVGLLYLLVIVLISLWATFVTAAIVATAAALSLRYFFVPPVFSFGTDETLNVVALAAFLTTALVITHLVSGARRSFEALAQREAMMREQAGLLDLTHDTIFVRDMSDVVTYWNRGAEELYGWTREEAIGKVTHQLLHTRFPTSLENITAALLSTGRWEGELVHTRRDGTHVTVASRWSLQRDEQGQPFGTLETNNDITNRKEIEESLRRSEAHLADAQTMSHTGSWVWSVSGRDYVFWSKEHFRLYDFDPHMGTMPYHAARERIHPDDRPLFDQTFENAVRERTDWELPHRIVIGDGSIRHLHTIGHPVFDESGELVEFTGTVMDVTDRRRAEEALRRQASLLEQTHDAIVVWEFPRTIVFWNRGAEQLYGFTVEEAIGRSSHELLHTEHPLPTPVFEAILERDGDWTGELTHTTRDGRRILVESRHVLMREADDRRLVLETNRDITGRRQAEEAVRKAQAELAHVARVTTLGEMAASIAHEVDQPLSGVVINANACLRFLSGASPNLDEARDGLQAIVRDGRRASDVIARIRALARRTPTSKAPVDINDVIREVVALAEGEARRARARFRTELAANLPRVLGDRVQLQQVVLNLLLNGLDAMHAVVGRPRELVISTQKEPVDRVRVAVQDFGSGIDPQLAHRMFEAFYTTKRGGLGMGLSISRSIVEQHGGRLWAVPNDGPGTTFHFTV
jgi:PAS domain S-box-containing protein